MKIAEETKQTGFGHGRTVPHARAMGRQCCYDISEIVLMYSKFSWRIGVCGIEEKKKQRSADYSSWEQNKQGTHFILTNRIAVGFPKQDQSLVFLLWYRRIDGCSR